MRLTVYLLRQEVSDFAEVIPDRLLEGSGSYVEVEPSRDLPFECRAWVQANRPKPPRWADWMGTGFDLRSHRLFNQSNSFVLLLRVENRIFAVTFGYGFNAVSRSLVEPDFGLKVTLNEGNPDSFDVLDTRTVDRVTRQRRTHLNVGSPVDAFGLNFEVDWLKHVSSRTSGADGRKLSGADSLTMPVDGTVADLGEFCRTKLASYRSDAYRTRFAFIDHLRPLRPTAPEIPRLKAQLLAMLEARSTDMLAVAFPSIPDDGIETWRLSQSRKHRDSSDLELADVFAFFDDNPDVVVDPEQVSVVGLDADGAMLSRRAELYDYLVAEVRHEDATFILSLGQWFRADNDYVADVRRQVHALHDATAELAMPNWRPRQQERDYAVAVGTEKSWLVLDRRLIRIARRASGVEPCDLLTPNLDFVHVKDMRSSATLSHLFGQGSVSATLFRATPEFADQVATHYDGFYVGRHLADFTGRPRVVYAIGTHKPGHLSQSMFFFSLVNLLQHVEQIRIAGFDVALCRIQRGR